MWRPNCMRIEGTTMTARELTGLVWRKSSFSGGNGGCVEVGWRDTATAVRDSKDALGLVLDFPVPEWRAFVASLAT
jgi:Domain of unknown function (DUF397)